MSGPGVQSIVSPDTHHSHSWFPCLTVCVLVLTCVFRFLQSREYQSEVAGRLLQSREYQSEVAGRLLQ